MGRLIPAGTGLARYKNIGIQIEAPEGVAQGPEEEELVPRVVPAAPAPASEGFVAGPATPWAEGIEG